jgi:hypothetical protein
MDPDPDPRGPKEYGSGSATLDRRVRREMVLIFCFQIQIHYYFVRIHTL